MAAYSLDLRIRVLRDADAGLPSDELAEKYWVSRAWVDRLKQRRRETGEIAPRKQTRWRTLILHAQLARLLRPRQVNAAPVHVPIDVLRPGGREVA